MMYLFDRDFVTFYQENFKNCLELPKHLDQDQKKLMMWDNDALTHQNHPIT